jgi:hypothetical protein
MIRSVLSSDNRTFCEYMRVRRLHAIMSVWCYRSRRPDGRARPRRATWRQGSLTASTRPRTCGWAFRRAAAAELRRKCPPCRGCCTVPSEPGRTRCPAVAAADIAGGPLFRPGGRLPQCPHGALSRSRTSAAPGVWDCRFPEDCPLSAAVGRWCPLCRPGQVDQRSRSGDCAASGTDRPAPAGAQTAAESTAPLGAAGLSAVVSGAATATSVCG